MTSSAGAGRALRSRATGQSWYSPSRFAADGSVEVVREFAERWGGGEAPSLERHWAELGGGPVSLLAGLVKVELKARFERGERPSAGEYLDRFPELRAADDRVLSLAYEEYCLLEECGESPGAESFCERYEPWADSLASQLQYHRMLSRLVAPSARPQFPEPGEWFGAGKEFHLREPLGDGGAARVFLAFQARFYREVALKITRDTGGDREPEIVGRLDHERIVPVWSVTREESHGLRGLCMPYRPGKTLQTLIERVGPASGPRHARSLLAAVLPTAQVETGRELPNGWRGFPVAGSYADAAAWVALAIAQALEHAHERSVIHRDVKPANILLTVREGPQLLDFNLADAPSGAEQAEAARSGGTLPYMAPEQLAAFLDPARWADVGPAADLFALGLVLRELLTGERAEAPDPRIPLPRAVRAMLDLRALPMPSVRSRNPSIPHALAAIVERCLAFEPADRYPSASALAEDLRRFLGRRPLAVAHNPCRPERLSNWTRRHRLALILAVVLAGAGAATLQALTRSDSTDPAVLVKVANDRFENKQYETADAHYLEAIALDSHLASAWFGRAKVAYNLRRDIDQSIRLCDRAIREAAGSDLAPAKQCEIDQFRCAMGLDLANRYLKENRSEEAVGELERVLGTAAHARGLVEGGAGSAPKSSKTTRQRVVLRHFRAQALDLLSWASLQGGDLQTCLDLRREAYRTLDSCFALIPHDKATLDALSNFLPMTLQIQADDAEVLGGLMRHRVSYPD